MNLLSRLLLSSAALAAWPLAQAVAADYDAPLYIEEAPEYVPVEIGSGWYLRGDVSYNFDKPLRTLSWTGIEVVDPTYRDGHSMLMGSVGFGYHFSDYFRGEVSGGFVASSDQLLNYGDDTVSLTETSTDNEIWTAMVSGYVDLGTYVGITPYLGGGIGLAYNKARESFERDFADPLVDDIDISRTRNHTTWAYTLNAGASYQVTDNMSVDLGYQYFSAPDLEFTELSAGSPTVSKGMDIHQVKVGLRYDLW